MESSASALREVARLALRENRDYLIRWHVDHRCERIDRAHLFALAIDLLDFEEPWLAEFYGPDELVAIWADSMWPQVWA